MSNLHNYKDSEDNKSTIEVILVIYFVHIKFLDYWIA